MEFAARSRPSIIQFPVVPENAVLVEGNAALAVEIGLDIRPDGNAVVKFGQSRNFSFERLHAPWKRVAQPFHELEQRQIDIGQPAAGDVRTAAALQQPLLIAELFRHPFFPELPGTLFRGRPLVLVIQRYPDRMMGIVNLGHEIRDGQLQLIDPQPPRLGLRRQTMA